MSLLNIAVGEVPYRVSVQSQNVAGCGIKEEISCFNQEGGKPHPFLFCTLLHSLPSVPGVTPKNVSVFRSDVDRTVVIVTWIPLTLVEAKGFIRYVITLAVSSPTVKRQIPLTMTVSGNNATFQGLDPATDYEVSVGTVTSNGEAGPGKCFILPASGAHAVFS